MKKSIRLEVTQDDINEAMANRYYDCASCPIAKAFERATGKKCNVFANGRIVSYHYQSCLYAVLPEAQINFIYRIDTKRKVEPFAIELEIEEYEHEGIS